MKIKGFSTEQFAGIQDKQLSFSDGINVIFGDNEAGKSTVISAIYRAFTESTKLDKRKSKEFIDECFPTSGANIIDARVDFSENNETYRLSKEWDINGNDGRTRLKLPDGSFISGENSEKKLRELVKYGNSICENLIFARQNHAEQILDWCFEFFGKNPKSDGISEAKQTVSSALSAVGGVSADKFSEEICAVIAEKSGRWDFDRNQPEKGRMDWQKGTGSIVKAFYEYKNAENALVEAKKTEAEIQRNCALLEENFAKKSQKESELEALRNQRASIENAENIRRLLESLYKDRRAAQLSVKKWNSLENAVLCAEKYMEQSAEFSNRKTKNQLSEKLEKLKNLDREISEISQKTADFENISEDFANAERLCAENEKNKMLLNSGKMRAEIAMQNPHEAEVVFADNSSKIITNESFDANGFFRIKIPNVGEIIISPQNVDVKKISAEIAENTYEINLIYAKYSVENSAQLREKADEFSNNILKLKMLKAERNAFDADISELQRQFDEIEIHSEIEISENLSEEISAFLEELNQPALEVCKAQCEAELSGFKKQFETYENAKKICAELDEQISGYESKIAGESVISAAEFEQKLRELSSEISALNETREALQKTVGALENSTGDISAEDLEDEVNAKKAAYLREIHLCECYRKILEDFSALRANQDDNFAQFNAKFTEYLGLISNEKISFENSGQLALQSGNNTLDKAALLSEGTKKTVLLAFRLVVLEHFYPNGGGLIVLDDDLLDMDEKRRGNSAKLLQKFAEKNQVILLTCDKTIAELVGGNLVNI